ncbi:hypothetical protein DFJ74DRAFT_666859 [Hyaloraphidium curvatum]|nr:hypothetical protein DFJ74DRAFT_666859 [Hyaloraphidium curvatum]
MLSAADELRSACGSPTAFAELLVDAAGSPVPAPPLAPPVDYLSHDFELDELVAARRALARWLRGGDDAARRDYEQRARLENALWRAWAIRANGLQRADPRDLNWHKDADTGFLYGPMPAGAVRPPSPAIARPPRAAPPAHAPRSKQRDAAFLMHRRRTSSAPATVFPPRAHHRARTQPAPLAPILKPHTPPTLWDLLVSSVAAGDAETREQVVRLVARDPPPRQRLDRRPWRMAEGEKLRCDSGTVLSDGSDQSDAEGNGSAVALAAERPTLIHPIPRLNLLIDLSPPPDVPVTLDTPTRTLSRAGRKRVGFHEEVEQAVIVDDESDVDGDEFELELDADGFDFDGFGASDPPPRPRGKRSPDPHGAPGPARNERSRIPSVASIASFLLPGDRRSEPPDQEPPEPPARSPKPMTRRIPSARLSSADIEPPPEPTPKEAPRKSMAASLVSRAAVIPGRETFDRAVDRGIDLWENAKELAAWVGIVVVAGAFARVS